MNTSGILHSTFFFEITAIFPIFVEIYVQNLAIITNPSLTDLERFIEYDPRPFP